MIVKEYSMKKYGGMKLYYKGDFELDTEMIFDAHTNHRLFQDHDLYTYKSMLITGYHSSSNRYERFEGKTHSGRTHLFGVDCMESYVMERLFEGTDKEILFAAQQELNLPISLEPAILECLLEKGLKPKEMLELKNHYYPFKCCGKCQIWCNKAYVYYM